MSSRSEKPRRLRLEEDSSPGETARMASGQSAGISTEKRELRIGGDAEGTGVSSRFFTPRKTRKARATDSPMASAIAPASGATTRATASVVTPSPIRPKSRALLVETSGTKGSKSEVLGAIDEEKDEYVPIYIHKNVGYQRFGTAYSRLTDGQRAAFNFVVDNYVIPTDFESNRRYGPLSGVCYEERALAAYATNLLEEREEIDSSVIKKGVCSSCGTVGHRRNRCPDLL